MQYEDSALVPIVAAALPVLVILYIVILSVDRSRRSVGKKPLGGSGPWVFPTIVGIIVIGWLVATWINR